MHNTLNVNDKGVTAGSVKGFSTIRFKLGSSVENGDTVLKLTEDTTIDYNTIVRPEVDNWLGDQMERTAHLIGMQGGKTLNLTGYVSGTGIKRGGDVEYALKTDNDLMTTTGSLDLSAYKWQNANVMISRALASVFGGKAPL